MTITKFFCCAVLSASVLFYSGCAKTTQPDDFDAKDGNAGFMASEVNDMDLAVLDSLGTGGLAKSAADPVRVEHIVYRWTLQADSATWVRRATVNYPSGTRERMDTVRFFGVDGQTVSHPKLSLVDSIYHVRRVTRTVNGNTAESNLRMGIKLNRLAGDTSMVKNGIIVGSYNGYTFRTVTVTNVTRTRSNGVWNVFPVSGEILIDRDAIIAKRARTIQITYNGDNTATAVITRKSDNKQVTAVITLSDGSES